MCACRKNSHTTSFLMQWNHKYHHEVISLFCLAEERPLASSVALYYILNLKKWPIHSKPSRKAWEVAPRKQLATKAAQKSAFPTGNEKKKSSSLQAQYCSFSWDLSLSKMHQIAHQVIYLSSVWSTEFPKTDHISRALQSQYFKKLTLLVSLKTPTSAKVMQESN